MYTCRYWKHHLNAKHRNKETVIPDTNELTAAPKNSTKRQYLRKVKRKFLMEKIQNVQRKS